MKKLQQHTRKEISGPISGQQYLEVQKRRTTITLSRSMLVLALISGFIMMGYAGAEVGFLVGGLILVLIAYAVFEVMLRAGRDILTSALAATSTLLFMFATDLAANLIGTSIRVGESLQKMSHAGLVILAIFAVYRLFRR